MNRRLTLLAILLAFPALAGARGTGPINNSVTIVAPATGLPVDLESIAGEDVPGNPIFDDGDTDAEETAVAGGGFDGTTFRAFMVDSMGALQIAAPASGLVVDLQEIADETVPGNPIMDDGDADADETGIAVGGYDGTTFRAAQANSDGTLETDVTKFGGETVSGNPIVALETGLTGTQDGLVIWGVNITDAYSPTVFGTDGIPVADGSANYDGDLFIPIGGREGTSPTAGAQMLLVDSDGRIEGAGESRGTATTNNYISAVFDTNTGCGGACVFPVDLSAELGADWCEGASSGACHSCTLHNTGGTNDIEVIIGGSVQDPILLNDTTAVTTVPTLRGNFDTRGLWVGEGVITEVYLDDVPDASGNDTTVEIICVY
jgi:hypothetical protein